MRDSNLSGSAATRRRMPRATLGRYGEERLLALLMAVSPQADTRPLLDVFRTLVQPWSDRPVGCRPLCPSNVADDGAPYEFSLALSPESCEIQFYIEPQGDPPGAVSNMVAGRAGLETAAREFGAKLGPVRRIEDIFLPPDPKPPFSIWVGASWVPGSPLKLKLYLNPEVQGRERAALLVESALSRLGHGRAWSLLRGALARKPHRSDELGIVSLDLSDAPDARVKVYVRQERATLDDVRHLAGLATDYDARDLSTFYGALAGNPGPFLSKPVITELTFRQPGAARPDSVTLEFPLQSYVPNDQVARERVCRCLSAFGIPTTAYERAIRAFSTRPLERGNGIHAHVTLRRVPSRSAQLVRRVGVYLTSEAYAKEDESAELSQ